MSVTSSSGRSAERRSLNFSEHFKSFIASLSSQSDTRLQRPGQRLMPTADDIATSISPSGWVATSSSKQIRLYNVTEANKSRDISSKVTLLINLLSKHEGIRAIALSEDLLAVITHRRLLVYDEYKLASDLSNNLFDTRYVDNEQCWTPKSVSITQTGTAAMGEGASASIAVGGEGENGVKVFRYTYKNGWNAESDRMILKCPRNNGAVKIVGFSPCRSNAIHGPMAFALTTGNQLYCWLLGRSTKAGVQTMQPAWHVDCNSTSNQRVSPLRAHICFKMLIYPSLIGTRYRLLLLSSHQQADRIFSAQWIISKGPICYRASSCLLTFSKRIHMPCVTR